MPDKWIARRGSRGESWVWESSPGAPDDDIEFENAFKQAAESTSRRGLRLPPLRLPSLRLPSFRLRLPNIPRPKLRRPRLTLPGLRLPRIRPPRLARGARRRRTPRLSAPAAAFPRIRLPRLQLPRLRLPAIALPSMAGGGGGASATPSRPLPRDRGPSEDDYTRFATILGAFSLIAIVTLIVIMVASLYSEDSTAGPPASPSATAISTPTQSPTEAPLSPTAEPSPTPVTTTTITPAPTPTPADGPLVPPPPSGEVSLALWANELDAWWFGEMPAGAATYHEGDEPPFLLLWEAEPGREYTVEITYECLTGGVPAIDLLTGIENAHDAPFEAEWGPGSRVPDSAAPIPETPGLDIPGADARLLYIYGGAFSLLPEGPTPRSLCSGERTISVPVVAADQKVILMGSVWLADSADHGGLGAADSGEDIGMRVSVSGAGEASARLDAGVISP